MFSKTAISKYLGWDSKECKLPSLSDVKELASKMKNGDEEAAIKMFKYYRFGKSPENNEEIEVMDIICEAIKMIR